MTATENTPEVPLTWTSKVQWGNVGKSHRAKATINGESWMFTVDQPRKGHWVARGWRNGMFALYQEGTTLKSMKVVVQAKANFAALQTCPTCKRIGGHAPSCLTLARMHVDATREGMAKLAPIVAKAASSMARMAVAFTPYPCPCPTPTHRMSCGVNATPKVVQL